MPSDDGFVDYVCEQAGLGASLTYRRMFGGITLYLDGKIVGLIGDDTLFVKPTAAGRALLGTVDEQSPYPGAKLCFRIDGALDDRDLLRRLLLATAGELPPPKPKRKRKPRAT